MWGLDHMPNYEQVMYLLNAVIVVGKKFIGKYAGYFAL